MTSAGGTSPTGGAVAPGGTSSTGGTKPTGGTSATAGTGTLQIGGLTSTGGLPGTGGMATGGLPSTGGASATGGASSCTNLQTDAQNCGTCGHSCLGGACVNGACSPVVVTSSSYLLFGIDSQYLYYELPSNASYAAGRVGKLSTNSAGSTVSDYVSYGSYVGPVASQLFWTSWPPMSSTSSVYECNVDVCTTPSSTWLPSVRNIVGPRSIPVSYIATVDTCASGTCITWWNTDATAVNTYTYTSTQGDSSSMMAAENYVYWIGKTLDSGGNFVSASLFAVDSTTLARAQLAGNIGPNVTLVDADTQSVLLYDQTSTNLLRVPLPLGLGSAAPQTMVPISGGTVTATEDATALYWIDGQGTLSSCVPPNCVSTTIVLANAQNNALRMLQDTTALYWGRSNPTSIVRFAK